ncbi:MAG: class I SAM-dependent methyltransferase [Deltaproteobacteria bacterium]|jgi:predicted O-methyltransferase YrrM|nr:class I SAM-dependent methyltransferase [Deltaproteobacteria bacterium]
MSIENQYGLFLRLRRHLVQLLECLENPYPMNKRVEHAFNGSIKFADCYVTRQLLERHKPKTCLEIGSFLGFSTRWLLESGKGWGMRVTAVDPNMRHRIFDNPRWMVEGINAAFYPEYLEIISGFFGSQAGPPWYHGYENFLPRRDKEWTQRYLSDRVLLDGRWGRCFDCIYIDAVHSYQAVMDGFRCALPLLSPDGFIIFHDALTWEGVKQVLTELQQEFSGKAEVSILDGSTVYEHPHLEQEPSRVADGIGFFKPFG